MRILGTLQALLCKLLIISCSGPPRSRNVSDERCKANRNTFLCWNFF